jgi:hypothetical protein
MSVFVGGRAFPVVAEPNSGRGRKLTSLGASALGERFYSWRTSCGSLHVCSIFGADEEAVVAAFRDAVVIGVARDGAERRPVCVLLADIFETIGGRRAREGARALGVNEWHVRFSADAGGLARNLARSLLS